ncbi:MAG: hypothetical protein O3A14_10930 [Cyanobacteria bacterium]|nr:hypothetical protein [Cyanobacteriota bacterium]
MLSLEEEKRLIVLLSLRDLGGKATKAQVLDNIDEKGYIDLLGSDREIMSSRNEELWRNDLAFIRHHLISEGYMDGSQRNQWATTTTGTSYAQTLATLACAQSQWKRLTSNAIARALSEISNIGSTVIAPQVEILDASMPTDISNAPESTNSIKRMFEKLFGVKIATRVAAP